MSKLLPVLQGQGYTEAVRKKKEKKRKKEKQTTKNYSRQMVGLPAWPKCLGWSDLWGLSAGQAGRSEGRPAKSAKPPAWSSLFFFMPIVWQMKS